MAKEWLTRQSKLIGDENTKLISQKHVLVFGLGGVGGAATEALCRAGVSNLTIVDGDCFDETNINRQIFATKYSIGKEKVDIARDRLLSINSELNLKTFNTFYLPEKRDEIFSYHYDYVVDAIDNITAKMDIIKASKEHEIPHIMALGAGNRLHPEMIGLGDIEDTKGCGCGLAKVMRRLIRKEGISDIRVAYSNEEPINAVITDDEDKNKRSPASISFVPPVMGYMMAGEVINNFIKL